MPVAQEGVESRKRRRLVIPVALAVTVVGALATISATAGGCGSDPKPPVDAAIDTMPDTPIV